MRKITKKKALTELSKANSTVADAVSAAIRTVLGRPGTAPSVAVVKEVAAEWSAAGVSETYKAAVVDYVTGSTYKASSGLTKAEWQAQVLKSDSYGMAMGARVARTTSIARANAYKVATQGYLDAKRMLANPSAGSTILGSKIPSAEWKSIEKLVSEGKFTEASEKLLNSTKKLMNEGVAKQVEDRQNYYLQRTLNTEQARVREEQKIEEWNADPTPNSEITVTWVAESDCCDLCAELDGQSWTLDALPEQPPLHPNCRCHLERE